MDNYLNYKDLLDSTSFNSNSFKPKPKYRNSSNNADLHCPKMSSKYRRMYSEMEGDRCCPKSNYPMSEMSTCTLLPHTSTKRTEVEKSSVPNLPYYVVPVLYVPHKPLYEKKRMIYPQTHQAYHCLPKSSNIEMKLSKSLLNVHGTKKQNHHHDCYQKQNNSSHSHSKKYSFEYYDQYFKTTEHANKYSPKSSSSDISFGTEKSSTNVDRQKQTYQEKYDFKHERGDTDLNNLIDDLSKQTKNCYDLLKTETLQVEPLEQWIYKSKKVDANCATDFKTQNSYFQTSHHSFTTAQSTQTEIKDIKKNFLVIPTNKIIRNGSIDMKSNIPVKVIKRSEANKLSPRSRPTTSGGSIKSERATPRFMSSHASINQNNVSLSK